MVLVFVPFFAAGYGTAKSWLNDRQTFFVFSRLSFLSSPMIIYLAALSRRARFARPKQDLVPGRI